MAGNAILMNLLFLVACIPVVTIAQAWCGLLTAIRYNIRGDGWFAGFKFGFKTRFWRGTICWIICLPVCLYFFAELNHALLQNDILHIVAAGLFFAFVAMVTMSFQILNVYIPTNINQWIKNALNFFRHPLELLAAAAMFWAPLGVALLWDVSIFFQFAIVVVAVYYTLAALVSTMLCKKPLLEFLLAARADGTLIAEEGARSTTEDEE